MPTPIIKGTLKPILIGKRQSYDPSRGLQITQDYESAGDNLNGLATQCVADGAPFDHSPNTRRSRISFTSSSGGGVADQTSDTWQVQANEIQKDLKEHAAVLAMPTSGAGSLAETLQFVENFNAGSPPAAGYFTGTDTQSLLFQLLIHGVTSYPLGQYVLRHTTNVSSAYGENVADQNVEFVYSTASLVSEITNASYWTKPCPGRLVAKIQAIEVQASGVGIFWGWRKLPSTETTAANNRIDISTEYWLAGWSTLIYGTV